MSLVPAIPALGQLSDPPQSDVDQVELPDEPFLVFVAHDDAYLRCGPAGEHYRTDQLRHGQELEVYVSTDDGWLGVRPVEDSFCWVHSEALEVDPATVRSDRDDRMGIVVEDKTVAWIGTNLGRARRYRWQVQLAEGEEVVIIGTAQRDGPDGPQTWFRIVPPSGEFRWIHQDQIAYTAEELLRTVKEADVDHSEAEFLPSGPSERPEDKLVDSPSSRPRTISQLRGMNNGGTAEPTDSEGAVEDKGPKPITQRISEGIASLMQSGNQASSDGLISRSSRRISELIPIPNRPYNLTSPLALQTAPEPTGLSYLEQRVGSGLSRSTDSVAEVGNGSKDGLSRDTPPLNDAPPSRVTAPASTLSTMEITSRPRLITPGQLDVTGQSEPPTPLDRRRGTIEMANTNTVIPPGPARTSTNIRGGLNMIAPNAIAPVQYLDQSPRPSINTPPLRSIPQGVIDDIKRQASDVDEQGLSVLFNKLVAKGASEPEVAVIAAAAQSRNATALSNRALEYMNLARRRDGQTTITPSPFGAAPQAPPSVPPSQVSDASSTVSEQTHGKMQAPHHEANGPQRVTNVANASDPASTIIQASAPTHSGVLVEVYSSDPNRPPFALTDEGGRTLAYVTPAPGIELRGMLGGRVEMTGETGFLRGVETPHILATAIRPWMRK